MLPVPRRLVAPLATVVLVLSIAAPVAAAEPPAGVVLDADVTVTATEPGGVALPGATVTLLGYVTDFPEDAIQELTAVTDEAGVATFAGVARSDVAGPAVHLTAVVDKEETLLDGECLEVRTWSGMTMDVVAADGLDIPVAVGAASSIQCVPPDGDKLPDGLVADAGLAVDVTLEGAPVDAVVTAFLSWNGWTSIAEAVAVGGTAQFEGLPRPTAGGEPVDVVLSALAEVPGEVDGCRYAASAEGGSSLQLLDEGMVQAVVAVAAAPFEAPTEHQSLTVVDADGSPVAGSTVFLIQQDPSGGDPWSCTATTDDAGDVTVPLYAWGTPEAPSEASIQAQGPVTSTETRDDCVVSLGPQGAWEFQQIEGLVHEGVILETELVELDAVCSTTGTPGTGTGSEGGGNGGPTLPPTDVAVGGNEGSTAALPAVLGLLAVLSLVGLVAAFALPAPRRR